MTTIEYPALLNLTSAPTGVPYRYGLFSAVEFDTISPHDRMGMTWRSDGCQRAGTTLDSCKQAAVPALTASDCGYIGTAEPFTAYILDEDSIGGVSIAEHEAQARARFLTAEQWGVESYVMNEIVAQGTADGTIVDVSGAGAKAPSDPYLLMLAQVESQLALLTGNQGMIYMSRFGAAALETSLIRSGGMLHTTLGTPVAACGGFPTITANTLPTGDAIYGTGPVKAARGEVEIYNGTAGDGLGVNDISIIAQRTYAFGWDCGVVGAEITF